MSNQLIMENYLLILKSTVEVFVHGTLEASNEKVRMPLKQGLNEIMTSQARTYEEMTKRGFYKVNNVDSSVIGQTLNKLKSN